MIQIKKIDNAIEVNNAKSINIKKTVLQNKDKNINNLIKINKKKIKKGIKKIEIEIQNMIDIKDMIAIKKIKRTIEKIDKGKDLDQNRKKI
jgi:hypothetical protein